jgi:hypothetical protein
VSDGEIDRQLGSASDGWCRRSRSWLVPTVAAVAVATVTAGMLAGCATHDAGAAASSPSPSSAASGTASVARSSRFAAFVAHDGDQVRATGRPSRTAAGRAVLCIPRPEPADRPINGNSTGPPRIQEKPCDGYVLAYLVGVQVGPGGLTWQGRPVTEIDVVEVTGRLRGDTVTVQTLTTAPNPPASPLPPTPCPTPAHGWPPGPLFDQMNALDAAVRASPNLYGSIWLSTPKGATRQIATVGTTGNIEQARAALSRVYPGALCVYSVPYSLTNLKRAQIAVAQTFGGLTSGNLVSYGEGLQVATGEVGRINDQQAAALAPYEQFLQLTVYLVPAAAPR